MSVPCDTRIYPSPLVTYGVWFDSPTGCLIVGRLGDESELTVLGPGEGLEIINVGGDQDGNPILAEIERKAHAADEDSDNERVG